MTKKARETVILIRIPEVDARKGEATLTLTRGDLGHLQTFTYSGLTLKGNLAETIQRALATLAQLEMTPPPPVVAADTHQTAETPDADELADSVADESDKTETEAEATAAPTEVTREIPPPTHVSPSAEATDPPVHQQIALF